MTEENASRNIPCGLVGSLSICIMYRVLFIVFVYVAACEASDDRFAEFSHWLVIVARLMRICLYEAKQHQQTHPVPYTRVCVWMDGWMGVCICVFDSVVLAVHLRCIVWDWKFSECATTTTIPFTFFFPPGRPTLDMSPLLYCRFNCGCEQSIHRTVQDTARILFVCAYLQRARECFGLYWMDFHVHCCKPLRNVSVVILAPVWL